MVDVAAHLSDAETMEDGLRLRGYNEFFKDVALKMFEERDGKKWSEQPFMKPGCTYHEHLDDDSACYRSLF